MENIESILNIQIMTLSGIPVTVASLCTCLITFIISLIVARFIRKAVERGLRNRGRSDGVAASIGKIVWYALVFCAAFVSLDTLGFHLTALLAGSAVVLMGIGFGLQNIAQNFISGIIILLERPVQVGDFIHLGEHKGWITNIGLRGTSIVTRDELTIIVPNSELISKQVVKSRSNREMIRISVGVGVEYGTDVQLVEKSLKDASMSLATVIKKPGPEVFFSDFADSSLNFDLNCWIDDPAEDDRIASNLRFLIHKTFNERGIVMAFPHRNIIIRRDDVSENFS